MLLDTRFFCTSHHSLKSSFDILTHSTSPTHTFQQSGCVVASLLPRMSPATYFIRIWPVAPLCRFGFLWMRVRIVPERTIAMLVLQYKILFSLYCLTRSLGNIWCSSSSENLQKNDLFFNSSHIYSSMFSYQVSDLAV